jgi:hypothetical protein
VAARREFPEVTGYQGPIDPLINPLAAASDDALDLLDILITEVFSDATKAGEKARLRTIKDLDLPPVSWCRSAASFSIPLYPMQSFALRYSKPSRGRISMPLSALGKCCVHPFSIDCFDL